MLTRQNIIEYCNQYNFDIRVSGNGRWIDQKCAIDVVSVIADCILNYDLEHTNEFFTTPDIWHYHYAVENVQDIFRKPGVESVAAKNEYDKFFQQPMEMLAAAKVLTKEKRGSRNYYRVGNRDVLEYIALRERNALNFLVAYIEKVLRDSGLFGVFENFFNHQIKSNYELMKDSFSDFTIRYTKINGVTECNRIFIKVLNPLAFSRQSLGTEKGRISKQFITYDMLMYNRNNFRDVYADKPKGMTRREYAAQHPVDVNRAYSRYQSARAKRFLRRFNDNYRDGLTEHIETGYTNDRAIHMHHIFPEADYPEICYFLENLIALTPTQHLNYAHPNGRTQEINEQYQHLLLLSKADRIKENILNTDVDTIYEFENFLLVLNTGFDNDDILDIADMDFDSVITSINTHYS